MQIIQRAWRVLGAEGLPGILKRIKIRAGFQPAKAAYTDWFLSRSQHLLAASQKHPTPPSLCGFTVVMPVYNPNIEWLHQAIHSIQRQTHPLWELVLVDDASPDPNVLLVLQQYAAQDSRIKVVHRASNGHIAQATNDGIRAASYDWVVFMDQDDLIEPYALQMFASSLQHHPQAGLIYSDEDQVDEKGRPVKPFFKPDWSPHLALSQAYLGHMVAVSKQRCPIELDTELNGSQDHDFWLRCTQGLEPHQIVHIPHVLYHWRTHQNSTAANEAVKPYAKEAGRLAVQKAVNARYPDTGIRVEHADHPLTYALEFPARPNNMVSIIIPTKDRPDLLEKCILSIIQKTTGVTFEVLVLNNRSEQTATFELFNQLQQAYPQVRVIDADIPFNWSKLNNLGAQQARGRVLVFLNNDTEVISPNWLLQLSGYAQLPDVGVVGGLLLFPDHTIQHSGVVLGMGGWADHVFHAQLPDHYNVANSYVSPVLTRNTLAVTGACMAVSRKHYDEWGGFDEDFIICGSDVEFCLKAHRKGLFNVMCAQAQLIHHESKTRGREVPAIDFEMSALKYEPYRTQQIDPFFNPNLSLAYRTPTLQEHPLS